MARVRWRGGGSDTYAADRVGTVGPNRVPRLAPMYCTEYRGWRLWYRTEYRKTRQYQYRRTEPRYKTTSAAIPTVYCIKGYPTLLLGQFDCRD
jgi:hypothetical protein